jgi:hypothetical protein
MPAASCAARAGLGCKSMDALISRRRGNPHEVTKLRNDVAPRSFGNPRNNIAHLHVYKDLAVVGLAPQARSLGFQFAWRQCPIFAPFPNWIRSELGLDRALRRGKA